MVTIADGFACVRDRCLTVGDTLGIIDVCKGLAVTDAYWIDNADGTERWTDVNLFDNELDETGARGLHRVHEQPA